MVVPLGGNFSVVSNISFLMKGWSERSIFCVGREEIFLQSINLDTGENPLTNLLLC